jgi:hypothetical protein
MRPAGGVSWFRWPSQHPSFSSPRPPAGSAPQPARSVPSPSLLARAQLGLVPQHSRSLPGPLAGKPFPQPGNSTKAQSRVRRQVA